HRVGGAQAVAAMAYGTESIAAVDVIVGPGNAYVDAAKRIVASDGRVGIDGPAGPSELVVIADGSTDPRLVALDLAAQAEHGPGGTAFLVAWDEAVLDAVSGANHVLPTGGASRFSGALRVDDFRRHMHVIRATPEGLRTVGPAAAILARAEGLVAHAVSVERRIGR